VALSVGSGLSVGHLVAVGLVGVAGSGVAVAGTGLGVGTATDAAGEGSASAPAPDGGATAATVGTVVTVATAVNVCVGVGVHVDVGTLVRVARVGVALGLGVGVGEGCVCLRPISGSTVSVGSKISTILKGVAGARVGSTVAVAVGFVVAFGSVVQLTVATTGTVTVSRGRFRERRGLTGEAI
jgi:hypothetical protein